MLAYHMHVPGADGKKFVVFRFVFLKKCPFSIVNAIIFDCYNKSQCRPFYNIE